MRVALVAGLVFMQAPAAWAGTGPHFAEGLRLLKQFDYDGAAKAFREALDWPGNTRQDRAKVLIHLGIAQSNQTDYDAAEASFKKALAADPQVVLPQRTSPKIRALFEKVQLEAKEAPRPPPVVPQPEPPPATSPRPDEGGEEPAARPYSAKWPAWLTLGLAVAAGGAGAAMGALNLSEKSKAQDKALPFAEAQQHADRAASRGLAANVLLGVAGAAAVASGVLFYFGYRKHERSTSATIAPSGSGLMVQFEVHR
jgi:tetratricopeptide (TPR) repeat protein